MWLADVLTRCDCPGHEAKSTAAVTVIGAEDDPDLEGGHDDGGSCTLATAELPHLATSSAVVDQDVIVVAAVMGLQV